MIKKVTVVNPKNESLIMELSNPTPSGIIIERISGLGPPKADISSFNLASIDGSIFTNSRMTERNIVMDLIMMYHPTIEDSRHKIYRYFPIKKQIKLIIETDNYTRECSGYIESNNPDIFSDRESTQISIICTDPYFYTAGEAKTVFSGVMPRFEFPFSNESLTNSLIEFGEILLDTRATFNYDGDADTGIKINIHCMGAPGNIALYNVDTKESIKIDVEKITRITGQLVGAGDDIIISTVKKNKYVRLLRQGKETNIISCINKDADWFQLSKGPNTFTFTADSGENNLIVTFSYRTAYGGI